MNEYNNTCLRLLDFEKNGLAETMKTNTEAYRKGAFTLRVTDRDGQPVRDAAVALSLREHDFKFGSTSFLADAFRDTTAQQCYEERFARLFNQAVVAFYWRDDEPQRGQLRFERGSPFIYRRPPADEALAFCERVGAQPKGHNMLWQNRDIGLPSWWPEDKQACNQLIVERIRLLAERYGDKIPVWDVTNECIDAPGIEKMPLHYDTTAWLEATRCFPTQHLILNDCFYFTYAFKREMSAVYLQAQKLLLQGARIDGIGMQYHLFCREEELPSLATPGERLDAAYLYDMLDVYARLGKSLHISEVTIPSYDGSPDKLALQAELIEKLYRLWFSHPAVQSVVWWNLADGYAYVSPKQNEDYYGGGLLHRDLSPKPAYAVLDRLLHTEWTTQTTGTTDADGIFRYRGFYGSYAVVVEKNGQTTEQTLRYSRDKIEQNILF